MSDLLAAEIANVEAAIGQGATVDPVERTLAEVEGVVGRYQSPEELAAEEAATVKADEARAAEYRQPVAISPEKLGEVLRSDRRSVVAAHALGEHGLASASAAMSAIPKDVLTVMDGVGMFGTGRSWQLMADLGTALKRQGSQLDPLEAGEVTADGIAEALGDRLSHLPSDAAASLAVLLNGLPANVRAALDELAEDDPDLLELGVLLGRKLWGFAPPRPPRKEPAMQTATTMRKSADDLLADARSLQASEPYGDSTHPRHKQVRQTVTRIYQKLYPQPKEAGQ